MRPRQTAGDLKGNTWFTINRHPFIGKLDPRTGKVVTYRVPDVDGEVPGNHWINVDKQGIAWFTPVWAGGLGRLDPRTADMRVVYGGPSHSTARHPDGSLWRLGNGHINKWDPSFPDFWKTPKPVKSYRWPQSADG